MAELDCLFGFDEMGDGFSVDSHSSASAPTTPRATTPRATPSSSAEPTPPALDGLFGVAEDALAMLSPMSALSSRSLASEAAGGAARDRVIEHNPVSVPDDVASAVFWLADVTGTAACPTPFVSDLVPVLHARSGGPPKDCSSPDTTPAYLPTRAAHMLRLLCPGLDLPGLQQLITQPGSVWTPVFSSIQHVCNAASPSSVRCARPLAAAIRVNTSRLCCVFLAAATSTKANSSRAASALSKVIAAITRALDVHHRTLVVLGSVQALRKGIPSAALLRRVKTAHEALTMAAASLGQIIAGPSGAAVVVEGQDTVHPFPESLPVYDAMLAEFTSDRRQMLKCFRAGETQNVATIIRGSASVLVRQVRLEGSEYVVTFNDEASRVTQTFPVVNNAKTDAWAFGAAFGRHETSGKVDVMPPDDDDDDDAAAPDPDSVVVKEYDYLDDLLSDVHQLSSIYKRDEAYLPPLDTHT